MAIEVIPVAPALGAEIDGVDLSNPVDSQILMQIRRAWLEHLVLVFRGQKLSDRDLVRFSRNFGDLDRAPLNEAANKLGGAYVPDMPEVAVISNVVVDGVPIGALGAGESEWHTDMSYLPEPPSASLLYSVELPKSGGNTGFLNMYTALEALSDELSRKVAHLKAIHDSTHTSAGGLRKGFEPVDDVTMAPGAHHPIVRTHPETGRDALFLGRRRNSYILGCPLPESEQLLDALWAHTIEKRFTYTHKWRLGDVVMWDNRCVLHRRDAFDPSDRRIMHRTQVKGDAPYHKAAEAA